MWSREQVRCSPFMSRRNTSFPFTVSHNTGRLEGEAASGKIRCHTIMMGAIVSYVAKIVSDLMDPSMMG